MLSIYTPANVQLELAGKLRSRRRERKHSRQETSRRSGVPAATIRRFETTGEIALRQLLMLVEVYGDLPSARDLFPQPAPASMAELIARSEGRR